MKIVKILLLTLALIVCLALVILPNDPRIIVAYKLDIPLLVTNSSIERTYSSNHSPQGDGVDIVVLTLDSADRVAASLDHGTWQNTPVPDELRNRLIDDCMGGDMGFQFIDIYQSMMTDRITWRHIIRHAREDGYISDYTFGLIDLDTGRLYYVLSSM